MITPELAQGSAHKPHSQELTRALESGGGEQLTAAGGALASAPPGIELQTDSTAVRNLAGGWTEGQATHRPADQEGQRGDASLVPLTMMEPMLPNVTTGPLRDGGATGAPGTLPERDSDIFSFLAGSQPHASADQGVAAGGTTKTLC